jgi:hypothetical protein
VSNTDKRKHKPKNCRLFYKTVVQSVLLYGGPILVNSESFRRQIARRLTSQSIHFSPDTGSWLLYPSSESTMEAAMLHPIPMYLERQKSHISDWAKKCSIYHECTALQGGGPGGTRRKSASHLIILLINVAITTHSRYRSPACFCDYGRTKTWSIPDTYLYFLLQEVHKE